MGFVQMYVEEYTQNRPVTILGKKKNFDMWLVCHDGNHFMYLRWHSKKVGKTTKHDKTKCVEAVVKNLIYNLG